MASVSFISLNIEANRHLDVVVPFLKQRRADLVCLQEVLEPDLPGLVEAAGFHYVYSPMNITAPKYDHAVLGTAIISPHPLQEKQTRPYAGNQGEIRELDRTSLETRFASMKYSLSLASLTKDGATFRIANTHMPVTVRGSVTEYQREALAGLMAVLEEEADFILSGDFNAPRGGEIFSALSGRWTDNIPTHYQTSMDLELHRDAKDPANTLGSKMVDGLFTTPGYRASDVELVCGVSDHCAITAELERVVE